MAGLSLQYKKFIASYYLDFNATKAAIDAGYSRKTARVKGSQLLAITNIKNEVNRICTEADEVTLASKKFIIEKIKAVLDANLLKYAALGKLGASQAELDEMPEDIQKMVTEVHRKDHYAVGANGKPFITHSTYKFKLMSKDKMAELLAKHTGAVKETLVDNSTNINHMSYGQLVQEASKARASKGNGST